MPSVTIDQPPCCASTVPLNYEYHGTLNTDTLNPKPQKSATYKVRLKLVIQRDDNTVTTPDEFKQDVTPYINTAWKYSFQVTYPGTASLTARLVEIIDGVSTERGDTITVSGYFQRGTLPATPCNVSDTDLVILEGQTAAVAEAANAALNGARSTALRTSPPSGYEVQVFAGVVPTGVNLQIETIRCRIEVRFPHPTYPTLFTRRVTLTVAKGVVREFGNWYAELLVPLVFDTGAKYYMIAEFFSSAGIFNFKADSRELLPPRRA
jgi:hypothetical protein